MARRPATKTSPDPAGIPVDLLEPAPAELGDEDRWVAVHVGATTAVAGVALDVELRETVFTDVDLSGRDLRRLRARDVRFEGCDLSATTLDSASLHRVEFIGCRMTGVMITHADLQDVVLQDCRADLANWRMTSASYLLAVSTSLREADFYDSRLTSSALLGCDLREATFRGARLTDVDLHDSKLDGLRDAAALTGADIAPDQVLPLALALLVAQGIAVTGSARLTPATDEPD